MWIYTVINEQRWVRVYAPTAIYYSMKCAIAYSTICATYDSKVYLLAIAQSEQWRQQKTCIVTRRKSLPDTVRPAQNCVQLRHDVKFFVYSHYRPSCISPASWSAGDCSGVELSSAMLSAVSASAGSPSSAADFRRASSS